MTRRKRCAGAVGGSSHIKLKGNSHIKHISSFYRTEHASAV